MLSRNSRRFTELEDWLKLNSVRQREFALKNKICPKKLSRLIVGTMKRIEWDLLLRVTEGTEHAIGISEFDAFFKRRGAGTVEEVPRGAAAPHAA